MIELQDVQFQYRKGGFGLAIDRLSVDPGGRVCWVGPSGSGKTTLLHLVAGIFPADAGEIRTCGTLLNSLNDEARRQFRITQLGLVFQDFALLDYLNVLENICLPYRISRALQWDGSVRARAEEMAATVGISALLARKPSELSQGERQRVAVCRAVMAQPKLVLADEPTANLDPRNATRVLDALESYATEHQATLVLVSHDPNAITRFSMTTDISDFYVSSPLEQEAGCDA